MKKEQENINIFLYNLEELIEDIRKIIGYPVNFWAVAATIESLGIRDIDAKQDYGFDNVFKLAQYVFKQITMHYEKREKKIEEIAIDEEILSFKGKLKEILKHYFLGLLFAVPMLIQVISVLVFDYGLWAWVKFNKLQATMVAIATIISFVVTGGYVQVLGYQLTYFKGMENYKSAYDMAFYLFKKGMIATFWIIGILIFSNLLLSFYPQLAILLASMYIIFLSALLLSSGILYAVELKLPIALSITFGTFWVFIAMQLLHLGIYLSHWTGMGLSITINLLSSYVYFQKKMKKMPGEYAIAKIPRPEIIFYHSYRYFIYGAVFFLFLFVDRILAWSNGFPRPPYIIWFNTPYELGMDWALIPLLTTMALLDYSVHRFSRELIPRQKMVIFENYREFNKYFKNFYKRQLIYIIIIGVLSIVGVYYLVMALKPLAEQYPNAAIFYASPITHKVFWLGSFGYIVLCIGLLNSLFFFTLYRPAFAMNAMIVGIMGNIFVGFLCSRLISYEYGVVGLIFGASIFAILTSIWARKVFQNLDYYYFAAF